MNVLIMKEIGTNLLTVLELAKMVENSNIEEMSHLKYPLITIKHALRISADKFNRFPTNHRIGKENDKFEELDKFFKDYARAMFTASYALGHFIDPEGLDAERISLAKNALIIVRDIEILISSKVRLTHLLIDLERGTFTSPIRKSEQHTFYLNAKKKSVIFTTHQSFHIHVEIEGKDSNYLEIIKILNLDPESNNYVLLNQIENIGHLLPSALWSTALTLEEFCELKHKEE